MASLSSEEGVTGGGQLYKKETPDSCRGLYLAVINLTIGKVTH